MTTTEILILTQTIVLFLTGLAVLWYTIETNRIRKSTEKQSALLAQQLLILQEKEDFDRKKEISFVEPIFRYSGANYGFESSNARFINEGGTIKNVEVVPIDNFLIKIEPSNIIRAGEPGKLKFYNYPKPTPEKLKFTIKYETQLGIKGEQRFYLVPNEGTFYNEQE